jgi:RimJ/RimL family protein N-acetyltransferase
MSDHELFKKTPWDTAAFGFDTYELPPTPSDEILQQVSLNPGHFTIKVSPLAPKGWLHDYGFYYCDTLIEPYCTRAQFIEFPDAMATTSRKAPVGALLEICHKAFAHGRYHRDFNLDTSLADLRYDNWLTQLYASGNIIDLFYCDELVGFIGTTENKLVLHAIAAKYRGRGLAKYLWSAACKELFNLGHQELSSSVSAANLAVVNLYASLGFKFRNAVDVYHRLVTDNSCGRQNVPVKPIANSTTLDIPYLHE